MVSIEQAYADQRVGEQLLTHFARRNEVRRTTPLFVLPLLKLRAKAERSFGEPLAVSRA